MAQIIKLKRSLVGGSKPTTSDLAIGELAMNVTDGKVFLRKSGSAGDNIKEIVTLDHGGTLSGSLNITGSITASAFVGDGSRLTNITVSQTATVKRNFTNSISWSVEHNLDTENAIVQAYNSDNYQLIPENVKIVDSDNILITFSTSQTGFAVVAKGGHIVSGSISADNIDGLTDAVTETVDGLGVFSGSAQVTLGGDLSGTADNAVLSQVDGDTF
jgi:hypothetical protein